MRRMCSDSAESNRVRVAVVGCSHGELDKIYAALSSYKKHHNETIDLLICCGDFQAVRNESDLRCMAVPSKYQHMQTFHKYYSRQMEAPLLTLFVGGNHEASNFLAELPYGGWVAPNIYYLGYSAVVNFRGLRIAGCSGIFRGRQYNLGHYECPPYSEDTKRSAYYMRSVDVFRMKQLRPSDEDHLCAKRRLDICISHDWPRGIHEYGNDKALFRRKPFFVQEAQQGTLGNPAAMQLLQELRPRYWFSAHLHVKFPAIVEHSDNTNTRFLALDKCLPRRHWLQILQIPTQEKSDNTFDGLCYDPVWLAILRNTSNLTSIETRSQFMPGPGGPADERFDYRPMKCEVDDVMSILADNPTIPLNFEPTAQYYSGSKKGVDQSLYYKNQQTTVFCQKFGIKDLNEMLVNQYPDRVGVCMKDIPSTSAPLPNPDEISLADEEDAVDDDIHEDDACCTNEDCLSDFVAPPLKKPKEDQEAGNPAGQNEGNTSDAMLKFKRRNRVVYEEKDDTEEEGGSDVWE